MHGIITLIVNNQRQCFIVNNFCPFCLSLCLHRPTPRMNFIENKGMYYPFTEPYHESRFRPSTLTTVAIFLCGSLIFKE